MRESISNQSISVFFPVFNDAGTIASLVSDALAVLPSLTDDYEVILINDGSTDETAAIIDGLASTLPHVRVVHHERNQGYGAALRSGFRHASKDLIFYTDGDAQYDVCELPHLHTLMRDGVDVVNGYKRMRADRRRRKVLGAVYNRLARFLFRLPVRDVDCDFRLLRRRAVQQINLNSSSGVICVELVHKLRTVGCVFAEAPVTHKPRVCGSSQFFTFRRVSKTALDFFALWLNLAVLGRGLPNVNNRNGLRDANVSIDKEESAPLQ